MPSTRPIRSTMMNVPLSLNHLLERAGHLFPSDEIVSRLPHESLAPYTYGQFYGHPSSPCVPDSKSITCTAGNGSAQPWAQGAGQDLAGTTRSCGLTIGHPRLAHSLMPPLT